MLALDLLAAHMIGDFILQSHTIATQKLTSIWARIEHVALYSLSFIIIASIHAPSQRNYVLFISLLALSHFIIDSRRWASGEHWPPKPILVDQALHLTTLALLARLLTP